MNQHIPNQWLMFPPSLSRCYFSMLYLLSHPVLYHCSANPLKMPNAHQETVLGLSSFFFSDRITFASGLRRSCVPGKLALSSRVSMDATHRHRWEWPISRYHKIMVTYPYPFFVVINLLFSCIIFINDCICILTGSPIKYLFMMVYVIKNNWG